MLRVKTVQEQEIKEADRVGNSGFDDSIERKKFWEQVRTLLDKLSGMEREVFILRFMDNLGLNDIAAVLDKNESTVKTHLYRALNKIRKESAFLEEYRESLL